MVTSEARIQTDRPDRYLTQICKHASAMAGGGHRARMHRGAPAAAPEVELRAEWSDTEGLLTFAPWGTCSITASGSTLTLRIDATDADDVRRIQAILDRDLERFGRRDRLVVDWTEPSVPD
ncbi:hypothetical protein ACVW00_001581 [Marmoricola sp. URHA0025 HA25]